MVCSGSRLSGVFSAVLYSTHSGIFKIVCLSQTEYLYVHVQGPENKVERGQVDAQIGRCECVLEGSVVVGQQEHFYLEPQVSVVDLRENDELVIHASTQVRATAMAPHSYRSCVRAVRICYKFQDVSRCYF